MAMTQELQQWQCIKHCGACCRLAPDERPEALAALNDSQQQTYLAMVGDDGWCIHYDSGGQRCRIYNERPAFCRVSELGALFGVPAENLDDFAISCCQQQIRSTYGGRSPVLRRFNRAQQPVNCAN
jgi:Fe-S-cluster containining protein